MPNMSATSPARDGFLKVMVQLQSLDDGSTGSDRRSIGFASADAHGALEAEDEYLTVADLAGFRGSGNCFDCLGDLSDATATSILTFGRKLTAYSAPR